MGVIAVVLVFGSPSTLAVGSGLLASARFYIPNRFRIDLKKGMLHFALNDLQLFP